MSFFPYYATTLQSVAGSSKTAKEPDEWPGLSKLDILAAFPEGTFSKKGACERATVLQELRTLDHEMVNRVLTRARREKEAARSAVGTSTMSAPTDCNITGVDALAIEHEAHSVDTDRFMDLPSPGVVKACHREYLRRTLNLALARRVCQSCARIMWLSECKLIAMAAIPNRRLLEPKYPHPAHELHDKMLVVPSEIEYLSTGGTVPEAYGYLCDDCYKCLDSKPPSLPPLSLSNRMWTGKPPPELQELTVPEQMLIALNYPRFFIFKLTPKGGHITDKSKKQRGMKGTVTTFPLNVEDVSRMLDGTLLPRPPSVLASVIGISFVGVGSVPKDVLRGRFRVRRKWVRDALHWLSHNNRFYLGLKINTDALDALPEDDVPDELLAVIRHEPTPGVGERESETYVPNDDSDGEDEEVEAAQDVLGAFSDKEAREQALEAECEEGSHPGPKSERAEPDVIPLRLAGCIDSDTGGLSNNELIQIALSKPGLGEQDGPYAVRHSWEPVSEFPPRKTDNDASTWVNHIASCYPSLFPYGEGGIEDERDVKVPYTEHARTLLRWHGRHFCTHHSFPFTIFSVIQKRQLLSSAHIQMSQSSFEANANLIRSLTADDLKEAEADEENRRPNSNPRIRALRNQLYATSSRVLASNESRASYRSQIWGTSLVMRPPSLWMTLNLSDTDEPVVQVLCGEKIDMDKFDKHCGPDADVRSRNVALDPLAAAEAFHLLIKITLESLFGVTKTGKTTMSRTGILGDVSAYFGVVEAQGRGTLHLHLILWLKDAPNSDEMYDLLATESFREKMRQYISTMICADIPGVSSAESLKNFVKETHCAYARPPDPDSATYSKDLKDMEYRLARSQQVHTCRTNTCLKYDKFRRLKCKRRAPFPLAEKPFVNADGSWGVRRVHGYLNSWCPNLACCLRANHDIKVTTNGAETHDGTWYITNYATKDQNRSYNRSAITAKAFLYHENKAVEERAKTLKDRNRLLLFRAINLQNRQQEISAPQAMSYSFGWGDVYRSHHYVPLYTLPLRRELLKTFPELGKPKQSIERVAVASAESSNLSGREDAMPVDSERFSWTGKKDAASVRLEVGADEKITTRTQADDYKYRGEELESVGYLWYFVNTYEESLGAKTVADLGVRVQATPKSSAKKKGRKWNDRVFYGTPHPMAELKCRIVRCVGHNTLPSIVGPFFPRSAPDEDDNNDEFHATCLALLKPWRSITDLKGDTEKWKTAFNQFMGSACRRDIDAVSGIRYYYQCRDTAGRKAEEAAEQDESAVDSSGKTEKGKGKSGDVADMDDGGEIVDDGAEPLEITEEILADVIKEACNRREEDHGVEAVEMARLAGFFKDDPTRRFTPSTAANGRAAEGGDYQLIEEWKESLAKAGEAVFDDDSDDEQSESEMAGGSSKARRKRKRAKADVVSLARLKEKKSEWAPESALNAVDPSNLLPQQRRVFDIVTKHAEMQREGQPSKQLLMLVLGEGGVGKSKIIQTITEWFSTQRDDEDLAKGSYTGIASSLIDGRTLHSLCSISSAAGGKRAPSSAAQKSLEDFWRKKTHFIIDEISMVSKSMLATIDRRIALARSSSSVVSGGSEPFAGVNVVLFGDFHQFPPVVGVPLYARSKPGEDGENASGGMIYEQFSTVVILSQQVRVTDERWLQILRNARTGSCTREQRDYIRTLILGSPKCPPTDLSSKPWSDAVLITPRHAVRLKWNEKALEEHAYREGRRIYVSTAFDSIQNRTLSMAERFAVHMRPPKGRGSKGGGSQDREGLPWKVELAVGMKVMVTFNVDTALDLANGIRGEIFDILFNDDEQFKKSGVRCTLSQPPICVLVKLHRTKAPKLKGLPQNVIPIFPMRRTFNIFVGNTKLSVARIQLPMTGAYAFTDYRSQGQTVERIIVDIGKPPGKDISAFGAYVALSRSRGAENIRLLRDFSDTLFTTHPSEQLRLEDERLEVLAKATEEEWDRILNAVDEERVFTDMTEAL